MANKFLNYEGLSYFWGKIKGLLNNKVDKVEGKGLSTNDLTNELKGNYDAAYTHSQAAHAPVNAEANILEGVKVNGVALTVTDKVVDVAVPTKVSQLTNDSEFVVTSAMETELAKKADKATTLAGYGITDAMTATQIGEAIEAAKYDETALKNRVSANEQAISGIKDGVSIDSFADVEAALAGKQAAGDYATKAEAQGYADAKDTAIAEAKKAGTDAAAAAQAAQGEVDALEIVVAGKADSATTLAGYGIADAYTKTEADNAIAAAIAGVDHLNRANVDALPESGMNEKTIYMVKEDPDNENSNLYVEYMYINGAWEKIGDTDVDLSGYVKVDDLVAITNSEIDTIMAA